MIAAVDHTIINLEHVTAGCEDQKAGEYAEQQESLQIWI
jgi:hypothetical protein